MRWLQAAQKSDAFISHALAAGKIKATPEGAVINMDWYGRGIEKKVVTSPDRAGYLLFTLTMPKGKRLVRVSRVVAIAYHGLPPPGRPIVDHINGCRSDNRPTNLRYVDHSENVAAGYRLGTHMPSALFSRRGSDHPSSVFTEETVREVHRLRRSGLTFTQVTNATGVSRTHAYNIVTGRYWPHIYREFHP